MCHLVHGEERQISSRGAEGAHQKWMRLSKEAQGEKASPWLQAEDRQVVGFLEK